MIHSFFLLCEEKNCWHFSCWKRWNPDQRTTRFVRLEIRKIEHIGIDVGEDNENFNPLISALDECLK